MAEQVMAIQNQEVVKYPAVKGYDEEGKPIFKKHIKDVNILTKRQTKADKIMFTSVFIIFLIQSITLLAPIALMFLLALQDPGSTNVWSFDFSTGVYFDNFVKAFTQMDYNGMSFVTMLWNSIWLTVVQTFFSVFMPSMTGYVMSKYKFVGRNFIYSAVIFSMVIPIAGNTAAGLQLHNALGTWDTPIFAVLNSIGGFGTTFIVYYGFFKSVSWAYAEAVQIDGGGPFTIFFKVMLPQAMPIMLTYAITNSITYWNSYEQLLLYMPSYPNISAGLLMLRQKFDGTPRYFAALIIAMVPTVTIFAVFSNKIMGSISIGGLKG